ncbi:hypothetical protein [Acidiplasma cupricumulans]|uniref:hypothetical protein n=1 Tax=Acidiplasma cupricumulans TaxID=312540 RepID=UPI000783DE5C|nr:hypothetical protein [Acidiplasma cupricumulans]
MHLIEAGFSDATPSFYKGEKFSLSRIIKFPWELHLRLFEHKNKGKIFAHVEISRKYFEHLLLYSLWFMRYLIYCRINLQAYR